MTTALYFNFFYEMKSSIFENLVCIIVSLNRSNHEICALSLLRHVIFYDVKIETLCLYKALNDYLSFRHCKSDNDTVEDRNFTVDIQHMI